MKSCPSCHREFPDDIVFCPDDGSRLASPAVDVDAQLKLAFAGRFRIIRLLGAGGMGRVFLAEQVGVGNRLVALKILSRNPLEESEFLLRFHNEAASAGRIDNPNVVTIYESGQVDDNTPYIAMQYLEGETLRQRLKEWGALPLAECNEIIQQIANGLNAAHRLGIIHRDLKPDNIFLTSRDENKLVVKVVDFGIAKLRESATHTTTGTVLGTPAYMSFEQACGMKSDELDARSDIYSLGVVAYEMLTGRLPFQSDTPVGYIRKHLQESPPHFRDVKPDLPALPEVERVVLKALAKEREERYASVLEFAREFSRALLAQPLTVGLQSTEVVAIPPGEIKRAKAEGLSGGQSRPAPRLEPGPDSRLPSIPDFVSVQKRKSSRLGIGIFVATALVAIVAGLAWRYWPGRSDQTKAAKGSTGGGERHLNPPGTRLAQILVQTSPEAQVYLDNALKGAADAGGRVAIDIDPGEYALRVSLAGKKDYEETLSLVAGQTATVTATLSDVPSPPNPVATARTTIVVETSPGAQVWLDNRLVGLANSKGRMMIQTSGPGNHSLLVSLAGMKVYENRIMVRANQENVVSAPLAPENAPSHAASSKRLSEQNILDLMTANVSLDRIEALANERGINFEVTPKVERDLRNAGATDEFIQTLRGIQRLQKWQDYIKAG